MCSLRHPLTLFFSFFFFNDTATTEIYTLSLHDALPILLTGLVRWDTLVDDAAPVVNTLKKLHISSVRLVVLIGARSEEHTSELQSRGHLVCRLLLEKKKQDGK